MRPNQPTDVLCYGRVSGRGQATGGTSLPGQDSRFRSYCFERGLPEPRIWLEVESAVEAKREERKQLDALLAEVHRLLEAGRRVLILTTLVDRWSRDIVFGVDSVRKLVRRGIGWRAIDEEGGEIDATTEGGMDRLEHQVLAAQREARRTCKRMVGARQRLKDAGYWVEGPAPPGYRRGPRALKRQNLLDVDAREAAVMVGAFERSAAGASLDELADWLAEDEQLARPVYRHTLNDWLRSRVFLGEVKDSQGRWIKGRHEALIGRDLFERSIAALEGRRKGGRKPSAESRTAAWLLRGLGSCPVCGCRMSASYSRVTAGGYYACARRLRSHEGGGHCDAEYARVDLADERAGGQTLARLLELRHELARPSTATAPPARKPARDLEAERAKIARELARAEDLCIRGVVAEDALARTRARLDEELGRLAVAEAAAARAERAGDPLVRRARLAEVEALTAAWGAAPVDVRRCALALLARAIRINPDHVEIDWYTADELCIAIGPAHLFAAPDASSSSSRGSRGRR